MTPGAIVQVQANETAKKIKISALPIEKNVVQIFQKIPLYGLAPDLIICRDHLFSHLPAVIFQRLA
jgi:hypothetical protein